MADIGFNPWVENQYTLAIRSEQKAKSGEEKII